MNLQNEGIESQMMGAGFAARIHRELTVSVEEDSGGEE